MTASGKKVSPMRSKPAYSSVKDEPYLVIKTVVGEVMPVAQDVYKLRERCFPAPHSVPSPTALATKASSGGGGGGGAAPLGAPPPFSSTAFRDSEDATALHVVAYLNLTAMEAYIAQYTEFAKARASVGLETLRFRGQMPDPPAVYVEEARRLLAQQHDSPPSHRTVSAHVSSASKTTTDAVNAKNKTPPAPARQRYIPPRLYPIGALRLRRVSRCPYLGRFYMMIATVESQCVLKAYRNTGVGGALLAMAECAASDAFHVPYAYLMAPLDARIFYENSGYVAQLVPPSSSSPNTPDPRAVHATQNGTSPRSGTQDGAADANTTTVRPCFSNMAQCVAAGYTPRVVELFGRPHLVMGKALAPAKDAPDVCAPVSKL